MRSCLRCHDLDIKLRSTSPEYLKHCTLEFPLNDSHLENFAFIQGGELAMTTHDDGTVRVWDLCPSPTQSGNPDNPIQTGIQLATHRISNHIIAIGYQTSGDPRNMLILVAAVCYDLETASSSFHSFIIQCIRQENGQLLADFSQDYQTGGVRAYPTPGVIVQDGLAIAVVQSSEGKGVLLVIVDIARRVHLTLTTGLGANRQWDIVVSGNDLLLFSEIADEVLFAAYFDLRGRLPPSGSLYIQHPPDVTRLRTYGSSLDPLMEGLHWFTVHPWDTPHWQTDHLVPVIFEATRTNQQADPELEWRSLVGIHWISPARVIRSLKFGEPMPRESRRIKRLRNQCMLARIDGATMLVPSTYGRRLLWVNRPVRPDHPEAEPRLETITMQTPWDSTTNEDDSGTQFSVPIDLNLVHRIDFDDEYGRLLVILDPPGGERYQTAHIFMY